MQHRKVEMIKINIQTSLIIIKRKCGSSYYGFLIKMVNKYCRLTIIFVATELTTRDYIYIPYI